MKKIDGIDLKISSQELKSRIEFLTRIPNSIKEKDIKIASKQSKINALYQNHFVKEE